MNFKCKDCKFLNKTNQPLEYCELENFDENCLVGKGLEQLTCKDYQKKE